MAFLRCKKGCGSNFVFKIPQYQALWMNSYSKMMQGINFVRCLTDKQTLKGKCPFRVHVFSPKVKLELCERCKRFSKLSYSVNTIVQVVMFTDIKAISPERAGASLCQGNAARVKWIALTPQNNPGCDLNHNIRN